MTLVSKGALHFSVREIIQLSERAFEEQFSKIEGLGERLTDVGKEVCLQDIQHHMTFLLNAIDTASKTLFLSYMEWVKTLMVNLEVPLEDVEVGLRCIANVLRSELSAEEKVILNEYLEEGIQRLHSSSGEYSSFISEDAPMAVLATQYLNTLLNGERHTASSIILNAVDGGANVEDIYLKIFGPTQHEIGRLWHMNKVSVAQEHYVTAATQMIMGQLYPKIMSSERIGKTMVATCATGELHEIGIRMVADLFEMRGWDTYYMGASTPLGSIISTIKTQQADVLAISATIPLHIPDVKAIIDAVRADPETKDVIILVGGRPFNLDPELWKNIGADGSAKNATAAVETAMRLVDSRG